MRGDGRHSSTLMVNASRGQFTFPSRLGFGSRRGLPIRFAWLAPVRRWGDASASVRISTRPSPKSATRWSRVATSQRHRSADV